MIYYYAHPTGTGDGLSISSPTSITGAKTHARTGVLTDDVTVYLRGGTYTLSAPLVFTSSDSSASHSVTWLAYPAEAPIISGGYTLGSWTNSGGIWHTSIPSSAKARQLYINGVPALKSISTAIDIQFELVSGGFTVGDSLPSFTSPSDLEIAFKIASWMQCRAKNTGSGSSLGISSEALSNAYAVGQLNGIVDASDVYLENAIEFLSTGTKGYFAVNTTTHTIYYVPRDGEDMSSAECIIPYINQLSSFNGCEDIWFKSVKFRHCAWDVLDTEGMFIQIQGGVYIPAGNTVPILNNGLNGFAQIAGAIDCRYSTGIKFEHCEVSRVGGVGLHIGKGSKNCTAFVNTFFNISGAAVTVGEVEEWVPNDLDKVSHTDVQCNLVYDVGGEYIGSVGIFAGYVDHANIKHNTVFNVPYSGVSLGWGWNDDPIGAATGYANSNEVAYNNIYNILAPVMQGTTMITSLSDGGAIYTLGYQGITGRSSIHDNYIHDCVLGGKIYLDQGSQYIDVTSNVVVNPESNSWLHMNTYTNDTASGNYATSGGTLSTPSGIANIADATAVSNTDPNGWDTTPKNIAFSAGITVIMTTPSAGSYSGGQTVTLSCNILGSVILYTTGDGTQPDPDPYEVLVTEDGVFVTEDGQLVTV